jgi:hypothetical protein
MVGIVVRVGVAISVPHRQAGGDGLGRSGRILSYIRLIMGSYIRLIMGTLQNYFP